MKFWGGWKETCNHASDLLFLSGKVGDRQLAGVFKTKQTFSTEYIIKLQNSLLRDFRDGLKATFKGIHRNPQANSRVSNCTLRGLRTADCQEWGGIWKLTVYAGCSYRVFYMHPPPIPVRETLLEAADGPPAPGSAVSCEAECCFLKQVS